MSDCAYKPACSACVAILCTKCAICGTKECGGCVSLECARKFRCAVPSCRELIDLCGNCDAARRVSTRNCAGGAALIPLGAGAEEAQPPWRGGVYKWATAGPAQSVTAPRRVIFCQGRDCDAAVCGQCWGHNTFVGHPSPHSHDWADEDWSECAACKRRFCPACQQKHLVPEVNARCASCGNRWCNECRNRDACARVGIPIRALELGAPYPGGESTPSALLPVQRCSTCGGHMCDDCRGQASAQRCPVCDEPTCQKCADARDSKGCETCTATLCRACSGDEPGSPPLPGGECGSNALLSHRLLSSHVCGCKPS